MKLYYFPGAEKCDCWEELGHLRKRWQHTATNKKNGTPPLNHPFFDQLRPFTFIVSTAVLNRSTVCFGEWFDSEGFLWVYFVVRCGWWWCSDRHIETDCLGSFFFCCCCASSLSTNTMSRLLCAGGDGDFQSMTDCSDILSISLAGRLYLCIRTICDGKSIWVGRAPHIKSNRALSHQSWVTNWFWQKKKEKKRKREIKFHCGCNGWGNDLFCLEWLSVSVRKSFSNSHKIIRP